MKYEACLLYCADIHRYELEHGRNGVERWDFRPGDYVVFNESGYPAALFIEYRAMGTPPYCRFQDEPNFRAFYDEMLRNEANSGQRPYSIVVEHETPLENCTPITEDEEAAE